MLVENYMSPSTITISDDSDYRSAFKIMSENEIHHLPVVNKTDDVIGILAQRDLKIAANNYQNSPVEIGDIMHKPVLTAQLNDPLSKAAGKMIESRVGCLPVMDDKQQLVGMLTETDLFRALCDLLEKD